MLPHKQGASFDRSSQFQVTDNATNVADLTGWICASQIRTTRGDLIAPLTFVWVDPTQRLFRIYSDPTLGTAAWPLGEAVLDFKLTSPVGAILYSKSKKFMIEAAVTQ